MRTALCMTLVALVPLSVHGKAPEESRGTIVVETTGFRNNQGEVRVGLYASRDGFPDKPEKAYRTFTTPLRKNAVEVTFTDIPFGTYAIGILHDENGNGKMDTNWLGIPKEGYGASNNAKGRFGPPRFEDAKFKLDSERIKLTIKIQY